MSLTQDDLQSIRLIIQEEINTAVEQNVNAAIKASENRMINHMNSVIENDVMPKICQIADGHLQLSEKLDRMQSDIEEIKETVTAHDIIITSRYRQA